MKKTNNTKNNILEFYTKKEVFQSSKENKKFKDIYNEECNLIRIAKKIKILRLENKMTQKDLAKKTTMPQSVIARFESGEHSISLNTLSKIASAMGKKIELV